MARVSDPYLIPGKNVLRNLVSATDKDALAAAGQRRFSGTPDRNVEISKRALPVVGGRS